MKRSCHNCKTAYTTVPGIFCHGVKCRSVSGKLVFVPLSPGLHEAIQGSGEKGCVGLINIYIKIPLFKKVNIKSETDFDHLPARRRMSVFRSSFWKTKLWDYLS